MNSTSQVLARKWRPHELEQVIGQEHVTKALIHALDSQRIHHAYLFTGTRGVGKTSLSRILAKSLNCEVKIAAKSCGICSQCQAMREAKNIDYIEIDAASNRGVEEMSAILESAIYQPSAARFKIFMIDEVHMLSQHAFNAMLKILEEPPHYTKFILATTETHKIPATIVSRCLQFHLKNLHPHEIQTQLAYILTQEQIGYDSQALELLAKYAMGSMRDGLSLTDQAIAIGQGHVAFAAVQQMLGSQDLLALEILQAVLTQDLANALQIASRYPQALSLMNDLLEHLHHISMQQVLPSYLQDVKHIFSNQYHEIAHNISPMQIQIMYEILLKAKQQLELSPSPYIAINMMLIRLSHFSILKNLEEGENPTQNPTQFVNHSSAKIPTSILPLPAPTPTPTPAPTNVNQHTNNHSINNSHDARLEAKQVFAKNVHNDNGLAITNLKDVNEANTHTTNSKDAKDPKDAKDALGMQKMPQLDHHPAQEIKKTEMTMPHQENSDNNLIQDWPNIIKQLNLVGLTLEFAKHTALKSYDLQKQELSIIAGMNLYGMKIVFDRFQAAINEFFKKNMKIYFSDPPKTEVGQAPLLNTPAAPTLQAQESQEKQQKQSELKATAVADSWVKAAVDAGLELQETSIQGI